MVKNQKCIQGGAGNIVSEKHFGINCPKQKCMYTHPQLKTDQRHGNNQQGGYFLGNTRNFQQLNPWLSQFSGNISPYPWILPLQNPNWQQQQQFR